ncbi:MAG TPA: hypothetical protein VK797_15470, partial [Tepidisphaeraceae bacterium]|nr:hypothetical protein [Tepidisphaeraceae bacterium]
AIALVPDRQAELSDFGAKVDHGRDRLVGLEGNLDARGGSKRSILRLRASRADEDDKRPKGNPWNQKSWGEHVNLPGLIARKSREQAASNIPRQEFPLQQSFAKSSENSDDGGEIFQRCSM